MSRQGVYSPNACGRAFRQVQRAVASGPLRKVIGLTRPVQSAAVTKNKSYCRALELPEAGIKLTWQQYKLFLEFTGSVARNERWTLIRPEEEGIGQGRPYVDRRTTKAPADPAELGTPPGLDSARTA